MWKGGAWTKWALPPYFTVSYPTCSNGQSTHPQHKYQIRSSRLISHHRSLYTTNFVQTSGKKKKKKRWQLSTSDFKRASKLYPQTICQKFYFCTKHTHKGQLWWHKIVSSPCCNRVPHRYSKISSTWRHSSCPLFIAHEASLLVAFYIFFFSAILKIYGLWDCLCTGLHPHSA